MDITLSWFVLKRLFYAEQNEYRQHTLDKYFTACVADAAYRELLICLRLGLVLPRESHDQYELNETQKWITHSSGSFSKSLFYAEINEHQLSILWTSISQHAS